MHAIRPDGVEVQLHGDGTWTELPTADFEDHSTEYADASWVSEYDFDRRTITLTRAGGRGYRLNEINRDAKLSDPDGRFEVFVAAKHGWRLGESALTAGEIIKVSARLRNDGYLAAWRADFLEDPIICDGTLWARYMYGGLQLGRAENHRFRHWTYVSCGEILRTPTKLLRTWTEAHAQWKARPHYLGNKVRAVRSDGVSVELHGDGTWTAVATTDFDNHLTAYSDAEWVSEYDFDRRTLTLTRVLAHTPRSWPLTEIVRDATLSDPDGCFEVFVAAKDGWFGDPSPISGDIVKVVARLDDDGYFTVWHPDFSEMNVCQPTLWGIYYGGYAGPIEEMPKHWVYVTQGPITHRWRTELRTWAEAHGEWLERHRHRRLFTGESGSQV